MKILANILWILTGGVLACFTHFVFGLLLCITIIGLPWGKQHFKMAELSLTPFGRDIELNF